jgi:hypothetical protein
LTAATSSYKQTTTSHLQRKIPEILKWANRYRPSQIHKCFANIKIDRTQLSRKAISSLNDNWLFIVYRLTIAWQRLQLEFGQIFAAFDGDIEASIGQFAAIYRGKAIF